MSTGAGRGDVFDVQMRRQGWADGLRMDVPLMVLPRGIDPDSWTGLRIHGQKLQQGIGHRTVVSGGHPNGIRPWIEAVTGRPPGSAGIKKGSKYSSSRVLRAKAAK